jgi:hypothetical protein
MTTHLLVTFTSETDALTAWAMTGVGYVRRFAGLCLVEVPEPDVAVWRTGGPYAAVLAETHLTSPGAFTTPPPIFEETPSCP